MTVTSAVAFLAQCFPDNVGSIMVSKMPLNQLLYHCTSCRNFLDKLKDYYLFIMTVIVEIKNWDRKLKAKKALAI